MANILNEDTYAPIFERNIKYNPKIFEKIKEYDYYILSITHGLSIETKEIYHSMNISDYPYIKRLDIYGKHGYITKAPIGWSDKEVSTQEKNEAYTKHGLYETAIKNNESFEKLKEIRKNAIIKLYEFDKKKFLGKVLTDMTYFYPDEKGNVLAPAILFDIDKKNLEDDFFRESIGLWLYDTNNEQYTKILNIDDYYKLQKKNILTYSIIFNEINKILKKKIPDIKNKKIAVGFFSCRHIAKNYKQEYDVPFIINNKIEKYMYPSLKNTKILNDPKNLLFKPLYIKTKFEGQEHSWEGALQLQHQGCGLNVLSFYDFMIPYQARAKIVCLSLNGTSIFKIIEYLDFYLTNRKIETYRQKIKGGSKRKRTSKNSGSKNSVSNRNNKRIKIQKMNTPENISEFKIILNEWMLKANPKQYPSFPNNNKYIVSRHHINDLIKLFETIFLYPNINGCVIIIKIYKTNNYKQQDNHRGQTISFLFLNENVFLVDPHQQNIENLKKNPPIYIKNANKVNLTDEYKIYNYFDMIWISNKFIEEEEILYKFKKTKNQTNDFDTVIELYNKNKMVSVETAECKIIQYRDDINYGGTF